ncbi:MAG: 2-phospho-L-lactate guanylyltransferase [Acidimicrobiales bacterium]
MRALLVPVKSFQTAKLRLAPVLNAGERAALARSLATGVLGAAGGLERNVVCDDEEVAEWARAQGARVIWTPGLGLSGAVQAGVATLGARGATLVVVAHGDLPNAGPLEGLGAEGRVTLVPDFRSDGTNVAVVPASAGFRFSYGPGSFGRHRAEAARLGLACDVVHDERLAADVDVPADLAHVASAQLADIRAAAAP